MTSATYRSVVPSDPEQAQATLRRHVPGVDGWCPTCRSPGPCVVYVVAASVLHQFGYLPRREPGATVPGLLGYRRQVADFDWFAATGSSANAGRPVTAAAEGRATW